jgi:preprotein translocase subunit SecG
MLITLMVLMLVTSLFLIVLVLIQRGKGGGLAGAFGGMGGQSAFGTKAGDTFTRITIGVVAFWIILCIVAVKIFGSHQAGKIGDLGGAPVAPGGPPAITAPPEPTPPAEKPAQKPAEKPAEN